VTGCFQVDAGHKKIENQESKVKNENSFAEGDSTVLIFAF